MKYIISEGVKITENVQTCKVLLRDRVTVPRCKCAELKVDECFQQEMGAVFVLDEVFINTVMD